MVMCFAADCKHYSEKHGCKYFVFPRNPNERKKWIDQVRRADRAPSAHSLICSCHFVNRDRKNGPTIFEHNKGKRFPAETSCEPSKKKKIKLQNMPVSCSVIGCSSRWDKDSDIRFFNFAARPKNTTRMNMVDKRRMDKHNRWLAALHRTHFPLSKVKYAKICSKHFVTGEPCDDPDQLDYVPTLHMGTGTVKKRGHRSKTLEFEPLSDVPDQSHNVSSPPMGTGTRENEENKNHRYFTIPIICSVSGCSSRSSKNPELQYFKIPDKPKNTNRMSDQCRLERHNKWVAALQRANSPSFKTKKAKICSRHFVTGMPSTKPDHPDYIPSLHMDSETIKTEEENMIPRLDVGTITHDFDQPEYVYLEQMATGTVNADENEIQSGNFQYPGTCCVSVCADKPQEQNFYPFPQSLLLANLWKAALNIFRTDDVTDLDVCEQHFDKRDFIPGTKDLKKMAIPSIQRNDDKQNAILNSDTTTSDSICEESPNLSSPATLNLVETYHNYAKPHTTRPSTTKLVPPSTVEPLPQQNDKDTTIVICDSHARIVIRTENYSLREKLTDQVLMVLAKNTSEDSSLVSGGAIAAEKKVPPDVGSGALGTIEEEVSGRVGTMIQIGEDGGNVVESPCPSTSSIVLKNKEGVRLNDFKNFNLLKKLINLMGLSYKCPYCGYKERDTEHMVLHVKRLHYGLFPVGPLKDEYVLSELIKEIEAKQNEDADVPMHYLDSHFKMMCQYCGENFPNVMSLTVHVKQIHDSKVGPPVLTEAQLISGMSHCKFCNRILNNPEEYLIHVTGCILNPFSKRDSETQICEFCGKTGTSQAIKTHLVKVHGDAKYKCVVNYKKYLCSICGRNLANGSVYRNHMLRHENRKRMKCPEEGCGKVFNTSKCLQVHTMVVHTPPEQFKYVCDECDKRFPTKTNLVYHQESHSTVRYDCKYCDKTFRGKLSLRAHTNRIHLNVGRVRNSVAQGGEVTKTRSARGVRKRRRLMEGVVSTSKAKRSRKSEAEVFESDEDEEQLVGDEDEEQLVGDDDEEQLVGDEERFEDDLESSSQAKDVDVLLDDNFGDLWGDSMDDEMN